MRHASFFSGVGGLDLGFERAGIKTISVCEIDKYASAVLAERFPDAPNLGSITEINADDIPEADIWSGGFPCQDLSVAGKRAGFAGKRSSLAFTFLDLVEQRRPRWLVLENVPGLFTSNKGADFGQLLHEMEQLGYHVAWRTLDARYFGVAQRRRRVFIVASLEPDRASQVLFECEGCERHPAPRQSSWQDAANSVTDGSGIVGTIIAGLSHRTGTTQDQLYVGYGNRTAEQPSSSEADSNGMRATDGLARRVDDQPVMAYQTRVDEKNDNFTLNEVEIANSLSAIGAHRTLRIGRDSSDFVIAPNGTAEDPMLPLGLDSHRYRCCGNGVVANVAEWIGHRIMEADREFRHDRMLEAMDNFSNMAEGLEIPYRDD